MAGISQEVKAEIIAKVKSGEKVADLSKHYGVSDRTIYAWLKQKVEGTVSLLEHRKLKKENAWLKEIVGVLTLELEKSKKKAWALDPSPWCFGPHSRLFYRLNLGFQQNQWLLSPHYNWLPINS